MAYTCCSNGKKDNYLVLPNADLHLPCAEAGYEMDENKAQENVVIKSIELSNLVYEHFAFRYRYF